MDDQMDEQRSTFKSRHRTTAAANAIRRSIRRTVRRVSSYLALSVLVFLTTFVLAVLLVSFLPKNYESEMKLIVERAPTIPSSMRDAPMRDAFPPTITDRDVHSAAELLQTHDLLEQVVRASGLQTRNLSLFEHFSQRVKRRLLNTSDTSHARLARAVVTLQNHLSVSPIGNSALIRVRYASRDPELSARVLRNLSAAYQNRISLRSAPAAGDLLDRQMKYSEDRLAASSAALAGFESRQGAFTVALRRQDLLDEIAALERKRDAQEEAAYAAGEKLANLKSQARSLPERQTTQVQSTDNAALLAQIESKLIDLRLKHSDMLAKYAPDYPLVKDVENQIVATEQSLAEIRAVPLQDVTTGRSQLRDWIAMEAAKTSADYASLSAQVSAARRLDLRHRQEVAGLALAQVQEEKLQRDVKAAEDNYLLDADGRQAARVAALGAAQALRLEIVQQPTVPADPALPLAWWMAGSLLLAAASAIAAAAAADRLHSFEEDARTFTKHGNLRVLTSIPASGLDR